MGLNLLGDRADLLCVLGYADDIVLLAETAADLQVLLDTVHEYLKRWRLRVNFGKTKVVVFGTRGLSGHTLMLGEERLQEATEYHYLGMWFDQSGKFTKSRRAMAARARQAMVINTTQLTRQACFSTKALTNVWNGLIRSTWNMVLRWWMNREVANGRKQSEYKTRWRGRSCAAGPQPPRKPSEASWDGGQCAADVLRDELGGGEGC